MVKWRKGICCGCQTQVPLTESDIPRQQELDNGMDDWSIDRMYVDAVGFLCVEHEAWGERCEGSGQVPQVVLKE
jgi:hypothetical protein